MELKIDLGFDLSMLIAIIFYYFIMIKELKKLLEILERIKR